MLTTFRPQTIRAVASLSDSLAELRRASREADRATETSRPGGPEERYALQLGRLVRHLAEAIADTPTDLWLAVCNQNETASINNTTAQAA
jgi:hypothetical protein